MEAAITGLVTADEVVRLGALIALVSLPLTM